MSVLLTPDKKDVKTPNSVIKLNFQLPVISPNPKDSKFTSKKKMISSVKKRKKKESISILSDIEMRKKYNEICNLYRTPYDLCIKCLENFPSNRNPEIIILIKNYLKDFIGLVDLISRIKNTAQFDNVIGNVAEHLKYKCIPPNRFVCRYGDRGTHFSMLFRGKIVFLVPKLTKCYLNKTEYIEYLLKLKRYGEHELLKNVLALNQQYFDLGVDFELFLKDILTSYKKIRKKNSTFLTNELLHSIKSVVNESNQKIIKAEEDETINDHNPYRDFNEVITPEVYIERITIPDMNLNPKDRKKVSVYYYQNANYYEGGQVFGTVALENKSNKISATAITANESIIGTLTKEEYQMNLLSVHLKNRELLYSLINSYDILGLAPKKAFDNRFCHMFKCIRYKRGTLILEQKKKINSVYVFYAGKFNININNTIVELYELVAKMKEIRGRILGIKESETRKEISDILIKKEYYSNNNYNSPEKIKFFQKKYNLTISIINDKLCTGLFDTLDPVTKIGLFNCTCESLNSDGYEITYDSLNLINRDYPCLNNTNKISMINLEYYLKRVLLHIKEIEIKIKKFEDSLKFNTKSPIAKNNKTNSENLLPENESENSDENFENFEIRRNTFYKAKKEVNNEINLVQNVGSSFSSDIKSLMGKKMSFDIYNSNNKNIYNSKYENIKTINYNDEESNLPKNSSYISRIKKSINQKKYLLHLAQCKSNKFMKIQREEVRSLLLQKNRKEDNNNYADLTAIFKNKGKNNKSENKSDSILDNIINTISKRTKNERILSSYLIHSIKEEENQKIMNDINKEDKTLQTEEKRIKVKKFGKNNSKDLFVINSRFNNKKLRNMSVGTEIESEKNILPNKNIITLDGYDSLGNQYLEENSKEIPKKYNKQLNMNKFLKFKNSFKRANSNKAVNVIMNSDKNKVHYVDPLLYDKFNEKYFVNNHKRFKTLET